VARARPRRVARLSRLNPPTARHPWWGLSTAAPRPVDVSARRGHRGGMGVGRTLLATLSDLALPACCAGCSVGDALLCPDCSHALAAPPGLRWPSPSPPGLPAPFAVADYDGPARAALLAHKEHGRRALATPLGAALARAIRAASGLQSGGEQREGDGALLLVPVPSTRAACRRRGHDPVRRMTLAAAAGLRRTGTPATVLPVLRQARAVGDQAGLSARDRAANLTGALAVPPALCRMVAGRTVIVVDDVVTTGATLAEAARALRAAAADVPAAAVVAATRRRAGQLR